MTEEDDKKNADNAFVPVEPSFVERLRACVEGVEVDLNARLPQETEWLDSALSLLNDIRKDVRGSKFGGLQCDALEELLITIGSTTESDAVAWLRSEWNGSGRTTVQLQPPPSVLPLREEATGVIYTPLYRAERRKAEVEVPLTMPLERILRPLEATQKSDALSDTP